MPVLSTVRGRLVLLLLACGVPIVGLYTFLAWDGHARAIAAELAQTSRLAAASARYFARVTEDGRSLLASLADIEVVAQGSPEQCRAALTRTKQAWASFEALGRLSPDGSVDCFSRPVPDGVNTADRDYFRKAFATRAFAQGDFTVGRVQGSPIAVLAYPVLTDDGGRVARLLTATIGLGWLKDLGRDLNLSDRHATVVFNRDGFVFGGHAANAGLARAVRDDVGAVLAALGQRREGLIELPPAGGTRRAYAVFPLGGEDVRTLAAVAVELDPSFARLDGVFLPTLGLLAAVGLLTGVLAWWLATALIVRPVRRLLAAVRAIDAGRADVWADEGGRGEIAQLARAFNAMTMSLQLRELDLREGEERYRLLAENATDMIVRLDLTGRRLSVSSASREILGYAPDELVGTRTSAFYHPDDAMEVEGALRALASGYQDRSVSVYRMRHKAGHWVWTEVQRRLLRDAAGEPCEIVTGVRDISARREAEAALRESEARYRLVADNATDVIVRMDLAGTRRYVSPACRHMLGYAPEDLVGAHPAALLHPDDVGRMLAIADELAAGRVDRASATYRLRHAQGSWIWVEARLQLVRAPDGTPAEIVSTVRDVTERQQQAEDLRAARDAAEAARALAETSSRAKSEFLAAMSHEVRTPLNGVMGFTGLILERQDLAADLRRQVEHIQTAGAALLTVVNDVLDFSKIEAGKVELDPKPFSPAALIADCLSIVRGMAAGKGLALAADLDPGLPAALVGDEGRLRQVLLNLLNNAIKFTPEGGVLLQVGREEAAEPGAERLTLSVVDTGIGIPREKQGRLFERFSQVDGSASRQYGGTGLGLAISKRLVELMGGTIGVASEAGQGSTFRVALTLPKATPAALGPTRLPVASEPQRRLGRLLLAEDVAINQEIARAVLEAAGYAVDVVADGAEAVMAVQRRPYDLVLMDVQMPVMDGVAATAHIRAIDGPGRDIPIVAMTANVFAEQIALFRAAGMNDHVGKPFRRDELVAVIERWLPAEPLPAAAA